MTTAHSAGSIPGHVYHVSRTYSRVHIPPIGTIDRLLKGRRIDGKEFERGESQRVRIHEECCCIVVIY
jgi:hypothetical protein